MCVIKRMGSLADIASANALGAFTEALLIVFKCSGIDFVSGRMGSNMLEHSAVRFQAPSSASNVNAHVTCDNRKGDLIVGDKMGVSNLLGKFPLSLATVVLGFSPIVATAISAAPRIKIQTYQKCPGMRK